MMNQIIMRTVILMMVIMLGTGEGKCRIHHLGVRNYLKSDTIASATVMSFYMKESGGASGGKVRIRKVFKGDTGLEGRLVVVEGFGNKNICLSNPRLGETKLFFLKMGRMRQDRNGQVLKFKLNDNILKINLRNQKLLTKLRDRRMKKKMIYQNRNAKQKPYPSSTSPKPCDMFGDSRPECVREPRAIKMMNDAKVISVTPATLPLLSLSAPRTPSLCSFAPCEEGGTCEEHDGTFTCHCVRGRSGKYCEQEADIRNNEAGFTGSSYIMIAPLVNSVTRTSVEFSFRTFHKDGILLLWLGHTDWLAVACVRGHVEVRYELGSGPAVLRSPLPVSLGQWHRLVFRRYHRDGMLSIDGGESVRGRGRGRNKSLNIKDSLYIGGHPYSNSSKWLVGTERGLQGCIRDLVLMRREVGLLEGVKHRHEVSECGDHPCKEGYCANNGECEARHVSEPNTRVSRAAQCTCDKDWRGRRCLKKRKRKKNKRRHRSRHYNETLPKYSDDHKIQRRKERRRRRGRHFYRRN